VAVGLLAVAYPSRDAGADERYTVRYADIKYVGNGHYSLQFKEKKVTLGELQEALRSDDPRRRRDALRAIQWPEDWRKQDRATLIKMLGERLKDDDPGLRFTAAESLGYVGTDAVAVLPALTKAAKDKELLVRHRALGAIARIGPKAKKAVPDLINALADENRSIAEVASLALGNIGPAAIPAVTKVVKHPKPQVRREAAIALAIMGSDAKPAVPALKKLLTDGDMEVAREARGAIEDIEERPGRAVRFFPGALKHQPENSK
jgi:HEAT repeat protein